MKPDFVSELGHLALAVRLKRISDAMVHGARNLYRMQGLDIEPNWYLIFKLLQKHHTLSITEIAELLRFSHPSIVGMVKKMKSRGYLESRTDRQDSRKQLVMLSDKALRELPELEKVWHAGEAGIKKMFAPENKLLEQLQMLEAQLAKADFRQRTLKELNNE